MLIYYLYNIEIKVIHRCGVGYKWRKNMEKLSELLHIIYTFLDDEEYYLLINEYEAISNYLEE